MAFKISNETKVGALTAITVTLFILGFNFLKGKNPLKKSSYFYAKFTSSEGLVPSNPVVMNGFAIGTVFATEPADEELNAVLVTIRLSHQVKIPANSVASIKGNPLGTPVVEIVKGDARNFLKNGDTVLSMDNPGFFGSIFDKLGPTQKALDKLLTSLDSVAGKVNATMTPGSQAHIRATLANFELISAELTKSISSLNLLLDKDKGSIVNTAKNLETFTSSLNQKEKEIDRIAGNLVTTSDKLAKLDLQGTLNELSATLGTLKATLQKLNDDKGSLGALMNDRKLYDNLNSTINSANLLMQDLRLHPKRYVNVSVFGKKDKSEPLMKPMRTDSITQQQYKD
jgi:phospholipid/cholesterol/gamma-HCH transport system substrate-binding protein